MSIRVPFNRPFTTGKEYEYMRQACEAGHTSGDGPFTRRCQEWLKLRTGCREALLTTSGTDALEMAAILAGIEPGDEVILPSFTFVSTANAFVLRGAVPVFVDIREDTCNIDEKLIEPAITSRTKAIVPVHYAGVGCEMRRILEIAQAHRLVVVEDAAQAICSTYRGKPLGSFGHVAALSFHETKNVISGEGGALLVNDPGMVERAEIIWQKGTNRKKFNQGLVDKYTWVDIGSSFLPSDLIAAFLMAQLEESDSITAKLKKVWSRYHAGLEDLERMGRCRRPVIPSECLHNAHLYPIRVDPSERADFIAALRARGILAIFHYVPLHSSPAGRRFGRTGSRMDVTDRASQGLVRLPAWVGLPESDQDFIIESVHELLRPARKRRHA